jgi:hypothetical protein
MTLGVTAGEQIGVLVMLLAQLTSDVASGVVDAPKAYTLALDIHEQIRKTRNDMADDETGPSKVTVTIDLSAAKDDPGDAFKVGSR